MQTTATETTGKRINVVVLMKGTKRASIRITKDGDRVTSEVCMSIAWWKIGGRKAAFSEQARLEARGYKVVSAA